MLGALLLLTHLQTKFSDYAKSVGLFVFLLSVSAVVENNLWWHVDSLAVFFIVLTLFFLDRDDQRFGINFAFAAASTGLGTGTKVIGLFFVLTIPTYLLVGILSKKLTWRDAFFKGLVFVGIMAAAIVISNPFLLLAGQRETMINTLSRQASSQTEGWTLAYAKGPASWLHIIEELYGRLLFVALSLFALGLGIWRSPNRIRHLLIATWAFPLGLYILFTTAIKPTHFFLPILLPVYSSLVVFFEFPPFNSEKPRSSASLAWGVVFASRWNIRTYWNSKYSTIEKLKPDIIILWSQRILDYTQEGALEAAVDPTAFQDTYTFFIDAKNDQIRGYRLIYRDAEGLMFVSDAMYELYFKK
jgi:hypothetical protein